MPTRAALGRAPPPPDRRKGDVHHADVEDDHELGDTEQD